MKTENISPLSFPFLLPLQNFVNDPPIDNFFLFFLSIYGVPLPVPSRGGELVSCDVDEVVKPLRSLGPCSVRADPAATTEGTFSTLGSGVMGTKGNSKHREMIII